MESMETHHQQHPRKLRLLLESSFLRKPPPRGLFIDSPLQASQLSDLTPLPYLGVAKQTKSRDLGLGEDLPGGEVRGWASPWLLSPFGAFLVPLCLILSLPISRLLGQPHQGSRVTWSEIWGHIKGTSAKTLRLCKELTETYCRKSRRVVIYSKSVA